MSVNSQVVDKQDSFDLQGLADVLVNSTREYIYIRPEDGLIIFRPNRLNHLNESATMMLDMLYGNPGGPDVEAVVASVVQRYGVDQERVRGDLHNLLLSVSALLNDNVMAAPSVKQLPFGSVKRELPILSEIALTYKCQNRCTFCYANSPSRGREVPEMNTAEVKVIIDRIYDEAHCPTVSFTGGEPTLRKDLPELVSYAKAKGMRVNLITNGLKCGDPAYVRTLAEAGLDSAQVSIEGGTAEVHDAITQHPGAWERATRGVKNLRAANVHTHTNTTICGGNRDHLMELIDCIADALHSEYFSMNMVTRTGAALAHDQDKISYKEIGPIIESIQRRADEKKVRFVWYSPVPYCIFNPVKAGLGSKSCACIHGLISVDPAGQLLPCGSYEDGIGDLLHEPFEKVWNTRTALYWRRKEFTPPMCQRCELKHICCGACPLYWDERGGFDELEGIAPGGPPWAGLVWRVKKALWSGTRGVGLKKR